MDILPASDAFNAAYSKGKPQVAWTSLISDLETPISVYLKLAGGKPYSLLLESVVSGTTKDRYSFITVQPDLIWKNKRGECAINRNPAQNNYEKLPGKPVDELRKLVAESRIDLPPGFPNIPISAGLFGYLGYDFVRHIENIPDHLPDPLGLPDGMLMRPSLIAVFDSIDNRVTLLTPVYPKAGISADQARKNAETLLQQTIKTLSQPIEKFVMPAKASVDPGLRRDDGEIVSNTTTQQFCDMVKKAKEYIYAGDIFQVVLSQRFKVPFSLPPFALYRALRRLNPSPFLFYLDLGEFQLVGSSPEVLVRLRENKITIRPIAGTRPRHTTNHTDTELATDLLADPKERAEHLMLLDLGRNDAGRVAKTGTVKVTESFKIELYSHVMHIVSNVEAELDPKYDALDALFAGFPAGTVSGAPKVRAMQIIEELEVERRGAYAGCVGYIGANGALDTCIALRTAVVKDGAMYVQAGGGVVADSDPMYEYNESCAKARALLRTAEEAVRFAGKGEN